MSFLSQRNANVLHCVQASAKPRLKFVALVRKMWFQTQAVAAGFSSENSSAVTGHTGHIKFIFSTPTVGSLGVVKVYCSLEKHFVREQNISQGFSFYCFWQLVWPPLCNIQPQSIDTEARHSEAKSTFRPRVKFKCIFHCQSLVLGRI